MRIELRKFKHTNFFLLFPENKIEESCLDKLGNLATTESIKIDAVVTSDDSFNPYIRIKIP
jgi:hypothetical protein